MYIKKNIKGEEVELFKLVNSREHKNKGIELTHADLKMLLFLANAKMALNTQLEVFANIYQKRSGSGYGNRMSKIKKNKIVKTSQYIPSHIKHLDFYYLSPKGLRVLRDAKYITEEERVSLLSKIRTAVNKKTDKEKQKWDHDIAIVETVVHLLKAANAMDIPIEHGPALSFPFYASEGEAAKMIPDWVFTTNDMIIHLELDTGSQRGKVIRGKAERYYELAQKHSDKKHLVLFSVIDGSFPTRQKVAENRDRRVRSLQRSLSSYTDLDNLSFYTFTVGDIKGEHIPFHFLEDFNSLREDLNDSMGMFVEKILPTYLEQENIYRIINTERLIDYPNAYILTLEHKDKVSTSKELFYPMLAGDVKSFSEFHEILEKRDNGELNVDHVIAVFPHETDLYIGTLPTKEYDKSYQNILLTYSIVRGNPSFYKDVGLNNDREMVDYISELNRMNF